MAKITKRSVIPIYAIALLWLVWGLFFPLHTALQYIIAVAASFAIYFIARLIWPDKTYEIPDPEGTKTEEQTEKKEEKKPDEAESTGNPEIDELIKERDRAVSEMNRLNDSIQDPTISAQINHLESTTKKIIEQVVEDPKKLPQIRRFMNYYLPTTLKILNAYDRMDTVGVEGENISATKERVADMLGTIVQAFDKQLDALFGAEALDISTDIKVMEQMLAREGLGGMQMPHDQNDQNVQNDQ
ncbi:MAG: 5-bromo-4-chloroindolyl phosphate hydrolysis family protein, partial [Oscillospiraceae bacterium]|nr:5-bromo-4-chloroindolyl phosphate hydrolysis family protein [Oscillospiraceae bacterium]